MAFDLVVESTTVGRVSVGVGIVSTAVDTTVETANTAKVLGLGVSLSLPLVDVARVARVVAGGIGGVAIDATVVNTGAIESTVVGIEVLGIGISVGLGLPLAEIVDSGVGRVGGEGVGGVGVGPQVAGDEGTSTIGVDTIVEDSGVGLSIGIGISIGVPLVEITVAGGVVGLVGRVGRVGANAVVAIKAGVASPEAPGEVLGVSLGLGKSGGDDAGLGNKMALKPRF